MNKEEPVKGLFFFSLYQLFILKEFILIYPEIENYELILANLQFDPIFLDDYDAHVDEQKELIKDLLYTRYGQNESLTQVPSCVCKNINGQDKLGERCPKCGTECVPSYSRKIEPVLWSRVPPGITSFINPIIWKMMSLLFKSKSNNLLFWLTDPYYRPPAKDDPKIKKLESLLTENPKPLKRGLNFFIENYDWVISTLIEKKIIGLRFIERTGFLEFSEKYKDCFFTTVLPVVNRNSLIIEQSGTANFTDTKTLAGVDIFLTINNLHHRRSETSNGGLAIQRMESCIVKCIDDLANYNEKNLNDKIFPKPGQIRKHLVGSRGHFTSRAVVTSLHGVHNYWEIKLPWGIVVEQFKEHIRSKLIHKHDMTPTECVDLLSTHVTKYSPLIHEVINELIAEAPYYTIDGKHKGIPVVENRNPTLMRGSVETFYFNGVKYETDHYGNFIDSTTSKSVLCITASNTDFDGDETNIFVPLDKEMHSHYQRLEPHLCTLDLNRPWSVSRNVGLMSPQLATLCNWLHRTD